MRRASILECAAALLLAGGIASPLGVAPGSAWAGDGKVDLTHCLAPDSVAGDVRVFDTNRGSQLTETVLAVASSRGPDAWAATVEAQLGAHEPTVRETIVKPGRRMMLGNLAMGDLEIDVGPPERWLPLEAVPGRAYDARVKGKVLRAGRKVGRALVEQSWEILGFEPLTTPAGSYPDTVHIATSRSVEMTKHKSGATLRQESDVELWCVDGVGIVAASYAFRFFEDGELTGEVANFDSWLVEATVAGVAVN